MYLDVLPACCHKTIIFSFIRCVVVSHVDMSTFAFCQQF